MAGTFFAPPGDLWPDRTRTSDTSVVGVIVVDGADVSVDVECEVVDGAGVVETAEGAGGDGSGDVGVEVHDLATVAVFVPDHDTADGSFGGKVGIEAAILGVDVSDIADAGISGGEGGVADGAGDVDFLEQEDDAGGAGEVAAGEGVTFGKGDSITVIADEDVEDASCAEGGGAVACTGEFVELAGEGVAEIERGVFVDVSIGVKAIESAIDGKAGACDVAAEAVRAGCGVGEDEEITDATGAVDGGNARIGKVSVGEFDVVDGAIGGEEGIDDVALVEEDVSDTAAISPKIEGGDIEGNVGIGEVSDTEVEQHEAVEDGLDDTAVDNNGAVDVAMAWRKELDALDVASDVEFGETGGVEEEILGVGLAKAGDVEFLETVVGSVQGSQVAEVAEFNNAAGTVGSVERPEIGFEIEELEGAIERECIE